ncbi:MAG: riboflavin synthase [Deltaproteobacteria bacterium]|nr:riboflavin synthase [Deltaproteobacteria bacterium]
MFTGIVTAVGEIESRVPGPAGAVLRIRSPWTELVIGESISVDGACLTVARAEPSGSFQADASAETLARTTLGSRNPGDRVHLERAMRADDRLGGHLVTGHIDAVGTVVALREAGGGAWALTVRLPAPLLRQVASKGSIALDGVSLTVNEVRGDELDVMVVPHTARATKLAGLRAGDRLNVETDVLAKYVQRALGDGDGGGVTAELLARAGFDGSPAQAPGRSGRGRAGGRR